MRTVQNYKLDKEDWDQQCDAGRFNPATTVIIESGPTLTIGAGDSDVVDVFHEGDRYYITAVNYGLDYAGVEVFEKDGTSCGELLLQSDIEHILGPRGVDLHPRNIATRLSQYIGE